MTIILQRLSIKDFDPNDTSPPESEDAFKIYTLIEVENESGTFEDIKNCTFEDISNLNRNDRSDARKTFIKFFKHAANGPPLERTFDDKQCHTAHEFVCEGKAVKILRLRLNGDIRIYFIYGQDRSIVIIKTIAKRKQKLNKSEISGLEKIVKHIIQCSKNKHVTIVNANDY